MNHHTRRYRHNRWLLAMGRNPSSLSHHQRWRRPVHPHDAWLFHTWDLVQKENIYCKCCKILHQLTFEFIYNLLWQDRSALKERIFFLHLFVFNVYISGAKTGKKWTSLKFPGFIQCFPDFSQCFPGFSPTKFSRFASANVAVVWIRAWYFTLFWSDYHV